MDHIKNVTGSSQFVGLGADYDGLESVAEGLEDVSKYPDLFDKLAITNENRTGWSRQDLRNLAGENILRVMLEVETYRNQVKDDSDQIIEANIPTDQLVDTTCRVLPAAPATGTV